MKKTIVVLTKSRKLNRYCVTGKEINTGEWIRLVSDDEKSDYAIQPDKFVTSSGKNIELLDIINVDVTRRPTEIQPENCHVNSYDFDFIGRFNISKLGKYEDHFKDILYGDQNTVYPARILASKDKRSLQLICADEMCVSERESQHKYQKGRLVAKIKYGQYVLSDINVTDDDFVKRTLPLVRQSTTGDMVLHNINIVLSLGNEFKGYHYKFVAAVFD